MLGDGSNDTSALAAADLVISLESGTLLATDPAHAFVTNDDLMILHQVFAFIKG